MKLVVICTVMSMAIARPQAFVLDPLAYEVIPCKFAAPDELRHAGYTTYKGVCLQQVGMKSPLVNYALESRCPIGNDDLAYVANYFTNGNPAVPSDASRNQSVELIADVIFQPGEARNKFVEAAVASQTSYFEAFFQN